MTGNWKHRKDVSKFSLHIFQFLLGAVKRVLMKDVICCCCIMADKMMTTFRQFSIMYL